MEKNEMGLACGAYGCDEGVYRVLVGEPEGKNHWGDLGVDGWIILGWICEERGCIGSWWGNWREGEHWGVLGVDGWIILGWISRRWDVGIWTGLDWPRIGTGGGRL